MVRVDLTKKESTQLNSTQAGWKESTHLNSTQAGWPGAFTTQLTRARRGDRGPGNLDTMSVLVFVYERGSGVRRVSKA